MFFAIHKDRSFKTSKYKNKQLKNSILELEKYFKRIIISINNMDKFKKKVPKKKTFTKNFWNDRYNWSTNYIPEAMN